MMLLSSLSAVVGLASVVAAVHDGSHQIEAAHHKRAAHHNDTAKRDSYSGQATYFEVGLGSCGQYSSDGDYMVALNTPQYGDGYPGPNCFKSITITAFGKSIVATILDECPSCGWGSLDLSPGLFSAFADESLGVFPITWWYNDGSSNGGNDDSQQKTTTSTKQWVAPTTTSTSTHHTTTSTTSTTPTTTTSSTSSVASSSSASDSSSSATGTASSASGSPTPGGTTTNDASQGGGIGAQQRLVANFGYIASTGRRNSS